MCFSDFCFGSGSSTLIFNLFVSGVCVKILHVR